MEKISIEICNWDRFNPRKDIKRPHWFALDNRVLEEPGFFDFSAEEKLAWIYLLCAASQGNGPVAEIYPEYVATAVGIPIKSLKSAIEKLCERGCTRITEAAYGFVQMRTSTEQTDRTDKRESQPVRAGPLPDLATIWNENCGDKLAKVIKTNPARNRKAEARLQEHSPEEWIAIIRAIQASPFCCGQNDRGWHATFDWVLQPETALKVLEGKYSAKESVPAEKDGWLDAAERVAEALKKFGDWSKYESEVRLFLGEKIHRTAIKAGTYKMRQLPGGPFYVKQIMGMLKEASGAQ